MWVYTFIKLWKSINRSQLDLSLLMLTGFHYQLSPFQIADTYLYSNKMTHKSEEVLNEPPQNVSLWHGILSWGQLLRQKVPEASHYVSPCTAHSRSIVSDSVTPWTAAHDSSVHGDSPDKITGVGCHAFLQGTFPTQGSNPGLPHCRQILYQLSYQGIPMSAFIQPLFIPSIQPTDLCFPSVSGLIVLWQQLLSS